MLKAVLLDVDFTLFRPGPELGPEGYRRLGERHGLTLEPELYAEARAAAIASLQGDRDLVHDEEVWIAFTELIVRGMGGDADGSRACAEEMVRAWEQHANFTLYEDALPALDDLRRHGLKIGLVSNGQRDLAEFVAHHGLAVDGPPDATRAVEPFPEDAWVGGALRIGAATLEVLMPTIRCPMPSRAQPGLPRDTTVAATLRDHHENNLGIYCSVTTAGTVTVGDEVGIG